MFGSMRNSDQNRTGFAPDDFNSMNGPPVPDQPNSSSSSLAWDTRVQCFVLCFALSLVSSFCASYLLVLMKLNGFCIMTSIGALLSLTSTCFLMGPVGQVKKMFDKSRWIATLVYIAFIIFTLVAGLVFKNAPLAILCTVGQYVAMAWYSLSYIPYAREAVSKVICSCF